MVTADFSPPDVSLSRQVISILYILECYDKRIVKLFIYSGASDMQLEATLIGNV